MALRCIKMPAVAAATPVPVAAGHVLRGGAVIDQRLSGQESEVDDGTVLGEHQEHEGLSGENFTDEDETGDEHVDSHSEFAEYDEDIDDEDVVDTDNEDAIDSDIEDVVNEDDVDSDSEFEEDGQPVDTGHGSISAGTAWFLGQPALVASVQNTTGFMRVAAAKASPGHHGVVGGEILVHYQYTRFLRSQNGDDDGVDMHVLGPKEASVRFHVPSNAAVSADLATTLRLAGASLGSLYPSRFRAELQALWRGLVTVAVASLHVSPRATRLVVTVDVGILRPGDRTPGRMRSVRAAMEAVASERGGRRAAVEYDDVGVMELHLPAPLASEEDDVIRPTKRRRVIAREDCPICLEALERGLAAWPRCSHVFHGRCLEEHLVRGREECPLCRTGLKVHPSSRESTLNT
ncbi:hypothetical protein HU200_062928 [Digitaria exilis]|uniref:RING-type domain-containing protein n=1 Tax=Digitaria exilis TaxID=1010633 RepID=A0A835DVI9_9POAL|nr:hypothetical protein HU200_062928 [Digitaria exilis]CAB3489905.1 unnamed protein product [Digitaria exilis]